MCVIDVQYSVSAQCPTSNPTQAKTLSHLARVASTTLPQTHQIGNTEEHFKPTLLILL